MLSQRFNLNIILLLIIIILLIVAIFYPIALIPAAATSLFMEDYPFTRFLIPIPLLLLFLLGLHSDFYAFGTLALLLLFLILFIRSITKSAVFKF